MNYPKKIISYSDGVKRVQDYGLITVVGEEKFFRDQIRNKKISLEKGAELIKIDCSEMDESEIFSLIENKDLFGSKRIFWISNFTKIKKLNFFFDNTFTDIIILDSDKAGKSKAFKELEQKSLYVDCSLKPWEKEPFALSMISGFLSKSGYSLEDGVAEEIYSCVGFDPYKIFLEIQKITLFNSGKSTITRKDLEEIGIRGKNYNIFDIVDKVLENKKKDALFLMEKVFFYESSPAILLISLWISHFESILYAKNNTGGEEQLFSYIKMSPTVIKKKLIPQANRISNEKLMESINFLAELDVKLRKGSFDLKYYLEKFIIDF